MGGFLSAMANRPLHESLVLTSLINAALTMCQASFNHVAGINSFVLLNTHQEVMRYYQQPQFTSEKVETGRLSNLLRVLQLRTGGRRTSYEAVGPEDTAERLTESGHAWVFV